MKYVFRNKLGDEKTLTEQEVKDLLADNGDMPDTLIVPTSHDDKEYFRVK